MKHTPGRVALALAVILLAGMTGLAAAEPAAPDVPESGHAFYGQALRFNGAPAAAGAEIVARTTSGSWTGSIMAPAETGGLYGYSPALIVPADDPDTTTIEGARNGDSVAFYVGGIRAQFRDPITLQWVRTYPFTSGGLTRLDLRAGSLVYLPMVVR